MQIHRTLPLSLALAVSLIAQGQRPHPEGSRLIVPVVVHAGGIHSEFRSDVFLFNRGLTFADLSLTFTPSGADGTSQFIAAQQILAPGHMVAFQDVVATLFHTTGSGALEISGDVATILARSTTYNVTARGKVGQSVIAVSADDAIGIDEQPLVLMPLGEPGVARTNIGITETAGKSGIAKVRFGTGFFPGETIEIPILPFSHRQVPITITSVIGSVGAAVEVISGDARVVAYASIIENRSGDPMYIAGKRPPASRQVIPVAAHLDSKWASEMWYAHLPSQPDVIIFPLGSLPAPPPPPPPVLTFYPSHQPDAPRTHQVHNAAFSFYTNSAVAAFFGFFDAAAGQIQFAPSQDGFLTTRLWTYAGFPGADEGTVGQLIDPVPVANAIGDGEWADAIGIAMTSERRTNVGITEITGTPARVQVAFVNELGTAVGMREVDVPAYGHVQFSITAIAVGSIDLARLRFTVIGGSGRVFGYASVVERTTNDPTFILAE